MPPCTPFSISNAGDGPFEAIACMAAGGQAQVEGERFVPPWAA